jgi:tetratricopeptide (TPR) repeat protein
MPKSIEELELDLENLVLLHGNFHDSVARCYNDMAKAYYREDEYESALEYYSKAAEIIKEVHGEGDEYLIDIHYRYYCSLCCLLALPLASSACSSSASASTLALAFASCSSWFCFC